MFLYRELCSDSQLPVSVIPLFVMEIYTYGVPCALTGIYFYGAVWGGSGISFTFGDPQKLLKNHPQAP